MTRSRRLDWHTFLSGGPSPGFIRWCRRLLFGWWILMLALEGPRAMEDLRGVAQMPPGSQRSQAMERVLIDTGTTLVALPLLLVGMLGYGVLPGRLPGATSVVIESGEIIARMLPTLDRLPTRTSDCRLLTTDYW